MRRAPHLLVLASATLGAAAVLATPAMGASLPAARQGEVHADLVSASGARIGSLTGSVGPKGTGWGRIAPLSGAASLGFKRPEEVKLYAKPNGTVFVSGQRGTYVTITDRSQGGAVGDGIINIADKKLRTIGVNASGGWTRQPFHPVKGQTMLVIGNTGGTVRTALGRRYKLVAYRADMYSRAALLANPSRYAKIAGLLIGPDVTAKQLNTLDLARSLHNEGRLVATAGNPKVLDRHMFSVAHMHLGKRGVILRRESVALGRMVHAYPQIREAIITHSKAGGTKRLSEAATFTTARRKAAASAALASLNGSLAKAERVTPVPRPKKGKTETGTSAGTTDPATVTAGSSDAAYYSVPVNQYISATVTAPSVVTGSPPSPTVIQGSFFQWQWNLSPTSVPAGFPAGACFQATASTAPSGAGGSTLYAWFCASPSGENWMNPTSNCTVASASGNYWASLPAGGFFLPQWGVWLTLYPTSTPPTYVTWSCSGAAPLQQTIGITYNPIYTVSLAQSTSEVTEQAVMETNAAEFDAVANVSGSNSSSPPMAAGSFNDVSNLVLSGMAPGTNETEAAFGLALATHSVNLLCPGCVGTSGGSISPAYEASASSPTQQVTQVAGGSSSGTSTNSSTSTNWETSSSKTTSTSVSATVGFFGPAPMASVTSTGGKSYTKSSSEGGGSSTGTGTSLESSVNYTLSNWTTTPVSNTTPATTTATGTVVPGYSQAQYSTYSTTVTGAAGSQASAAFSLPFPATQTSNGGGFIATASGYNGNGPGPTCTPGIGCAAPTLSPQPYGSGENITGFAQGSTSNFTLNSSGNQLATGSASPMVNDTYYLFDQGISNTMPVGAYLELQVLGQQDVSVAEPGANDPATVATATSGASGASGITTYYNAQGQVINGGAASSSTTVNGSTSSSTAAYQTTGLDLCAPPVLTPALWNAGCQNDPNFSGPPAVYASGPTIATKSTSNPIVINATSGQPEVASPAPALACAPGTWSGNPSFTYQWQQWNATFSTWNNVSGATSSSFTPPSGLAASTYYLCQVTAKNGIGSSSVLSPSLDVIVN
jgi:hypothetical protein